MSKRKSLTLKQKLQIIKEVEENVNKQKICQKYRCDISTVYRILRTKNEIKRSSVDSTNLNRKRNRKGVRDNVEMALALWYDQERQANSNVSSLMLINKAKEFAADFSEQFEPNSNWLFRWKRRHNIKVGQVHSKANASNTGSDTSYAETILPRLVAEFSPENIMNADESGLFYKALPSGTNYHPDRQPLGQRSQKERFTLLFICNSTGSFKRVYVIGKSKKPSRLKHVNFPVPYMSNKMAWMTTVLWCDILHSLDNEMQNENRNIILFVDNAYCHKTPALRNIQIQYLPTSTDGMQPLEQGIVHSFKTCYRQIIVKKQLSALERDMSIENFYRSISVMDALYFIKRAWCLVPPATIATGFTKAGFTKTPEDGIFEMFPNSEDYIKCDDNLKCYAEITELVKEEITSEEETEEEDEFFNKTPSTKDALDALNVLQKYCLHSNIDTILLDQMEDRILKLSMRTCKLLLDPVCLLQKSSK